MQKIFEGMTATEMAAALTEAMMQPVHEALAKFLQANPEINMSADHLADGVGEEETELFKKGARSGWFRALVMYVDMDAEGVPEYVDGANQRWPNVSKAPQGQNTDWPKMYREAIACLELSKQQFESLRVASNEWKEKYVKEISDLTAQLADKDRIILEARLYQKDQLKGLHKKINDLINENEELKKKAI